MLVLALDTSGREASVAVLRGETLLAHIGGVSPEPYVVRLFADVERVLAEAGVSTGQVELFAVATGPGSFTGLRVGLTAVKAWAEVFNRPIAAVSVLEAVAVQVAEEGQGILVPVMDARGGQVFGAMYRLGDRGAYHMELAGVERLLPIGEFVAWVETQVRPGEDPLFVSPALDALGPLLGGVIGGATAGATAGGGRGGRRMRQASGILAPFVGRLGYGRAMRGEVVDSLRLEANYVRRSDAEANFKSP